MNFINPITFGQFGTISKGARVTLVTPLPDGTIPNGALLFDGKPLLFDGNFIVYSGV